MKKISILSGTLLFIVATFSSKEHNNNINYKTLQQEDDELYDEGHYDGWNHKKPSDPEDEDYMEGYLDGKKHRRN